MARIWQLALLALALLGISGCCVDDGYGCYGYNPPPPQASPA